MSDYFEHQEKRQMRSVSLDVVDLPDVLVTEEPLTPEALKRFRDAQDARTWELVAA